MSTSEILPPQPEPQTSGAFSDDGKSGRVTTSLYRLFNFYRGLGSLF